MDVVALTQPDPTKRSIEDALVEALEWRGVTSLSLAVAWARGSGLDIVEDPIKKLKRKKGVTIRALIGVDQHGATVEALEQALRIFGETRIYHDKAKFRIFHPKLYVVETPKKARVIVGSGNLTEGGLATNYELAAQLDLGLGDDVDKGILRDFLEWFDRRWKEPKASKKLTKKLIKQLQTDPDVVVVPESEVVVPSGNRRSSGGTGNRVFTESVSGLRGTRRKKRPRPDSDRWDGATPTGATGASSGKGTTSATPRRGSGSGASPNPQLVAPRDTVLVAGVPRDRLGQAGFNSTISEKFFEVSRNGETILAASVDGKGKVGGMTARPLIYPAGSNRNHRFEMRDPDASRAASKYQARIRPLILVRKIGNGRFRYLYLYPGDSGYAAMKRKIRAGEGVGTWQQEYTKRIYLRLRDVQALWPSCPL